MNRSFARNLALILTCLTVLILATLPAYDVTVAQAKPTATPSKPAPAAEGGVQRIIFVANKNGATNLFTMDSDGQNIVQLTKSGDYKMFPSFSPDGKKIAFLSATRASGPPQLKVMDADGKNLRQLPLGKAVAISPPAWSPDSSEIAYISVRAQAKDSGIYLFNVAKQQESKLKLVTAVDFSYVPDKRNIALTDAFAPSWSPDGKYLLAFGKLESAVEKTTLLISREDGSARSFLKNASLVAANAVWSPDGSQVFVIMTKQEGQYTNLSFYFADSEGKIVSNIRIDPTTIPQFPAWSPDGKQIVFTGLSFLTQMARIYVTDADAWDPRQITDDKFSKGDVFASWGVIAPEFAKRK